jgi:hypothetical protein
MPTDDVNNGYAIYVSSACCHFQWDFLNGAYCKRAVAFSSADAERNVNGRKPSRQVGFVARLAACPGSVRGMPVLNSQRCPRLAPHVGQGTACACCCLTLLFISA